MELTNEDLRVLKEKELQILKEFSRVCSLLNLKFWLTGGSLLGAIRHQGFIPWDDDIDVNMPFSDYLILKKNWAAISSDLYFFQDGETDPEYLLPWAKIRLRGTTFLENSFRNVKINDGIYIDIFPLFSFSDSKFSQWLFAKRYQILSNRVNSRYLLPDTSRLKKLVCFFLSGFASPKRASNKLWKLTRIYDCRNLKSKTYASMSFTMKYVVKDWFSVFKNAKFETMLIPVPVEYDRFLTFMYGDYMKLPPLDQRSPHHYVTAFEINNEEKTK